MIDLTKPENVQKVMSGLKEIRDDDTFHRSLETNNALNNVLIALAAFKGELEKDNGTGGAAVQTNEDRLLNYYTEWVEREQLAKTQNGRADGFSTEHCRTVIQTIKMTLDLLDIHVPGITKN